MHFCSTRRSFVCAARHARRYARAQLCLFCGKPAPAAKDVRSVWLKSKGSAVDMVSCDTTCSSACSMSLFLHTSLTTNRCARDNLCLARRYRHDMCTQSAEPGVLTSSCATRSAAGNSTPSDDSTEWIGHIASLLRRRGPLPLSVLSAQLDDDALEKISERYGGLLKFCQAHSSVLCTEQLRCGVRVVMTQVPLPHVVSPSTTNSTAAITAYELAYRKRLQRVLALLSAAAHVPRVLPPSDGLSSKPTVEELRRGLAALMVPLKGGVSETHETLTQMLRQCPHLVHYDTQSGHVSLVTEQNTDDASSTKRGARAMPTKVSIPAPGQRRSHACAHTPAIAHTPPASISWPTGKSKRGAISPLGTGVAPPGVQSALSRRNNDHSACDAHDDGNEALVPCSKANSELERFIRVNVPTTFHITLRSLLARVPLASSRSWYIDSAVGECTSSGDHALAVLTQQLPESYQCDTNKKNTHGSGSGSSCSLWDVRRYGHTCNDVFVRIFGLRGQCSEDASTVYDPEKAARVEQEAGAYRFLALAARLLHEVHLPNTKSCTTIGIGQADVGRDCTMGNNDSNKECKHRSTSHTNEVSRKVGDANNNKLVIWNDQGEEMARPERPHCFAHGVMMSDLPDVLSPVLLQDITNFFYATTADGRRSADMAETANPQTRFILLFDRLRHVFDVQLDRGVVRMWSALPADEQPGSLMRETTPLPLVLNCLEHALNHNPHISSANTNGKSYLCHGVPLTTAVLWDSLPTLAQLQLLILFSHVGSKPFSARTDASKYDVATTTTTSSDAATRMHEREDDDMKRISKDNTQAGHVMTDAAYTESDWMSILRRGGCGSASVELALHRWLTDAVPLSDCHAALRRFIHAHSMLLFYARPTTEDANCSTSNNRDVEDVVLTPALAAASAMSTRRGRTTSFFAASNAQSARYCANDNEERESRHSGGAGDGGGGSNSTTNKNNSSTSILSSSFGATAVQPSLRERAKMPRNESCMSTVRKSIAASLPPPPSKGRSAYSPSHERIMLQHVHDEMPTSHPLVIWAITQLPSARAAIETGWQISGSMLARHPQLFRAYRHFSGQIDVYGRADGQPPPRSVLQPRLNTPAAVVKFMALNAMGGISSMRMTQMLSDEARYMLRRLGSCTALAKQLPMWFDVRHDAFRLDSAIITYIGPLAPSRKMTETHKVITPAQAEKLDSGTSSLGHARDSVHRYCTGARDSIQVSQSMPDLTDTAIASDKSKGNTHRRLDQHDAYAEDSYGHGQRGATTGEVQGAGYVINGTLEPVVFARGTWRPVKHDDVAKGGGGGCVDTQCRNRG